MRNRVKLVVDSALRLATAGSGGFVMIWGSLTSGHTIFGNKMETFVIVSRKFDLVLMLVGSLLLTVSLFLMALLWKFCDMRGLGVSRPPGYFAIFIVVSLFFTAVVAARTWSTMS